MSTKGSDLSKFNDAYAGGTEGEEETAAVGDHGRLSGFKRPRINDKSKAPQTTKKGSKGKGRNFGKLVQLMDMPLDIFFEITAKLHPLDILHLSRVSKQFHTTFASRNSRHIWVAARRNLSDMPQCPSDLTEPQYASLMFEHHCQACGKPRPQKTDYALRVRFCATCFHENVQKGSTLLKSYHKLPTAILTLFPRSMLKHPHVYRSGRRVYTNTTFESGDNWRQNAFYIPELEMVVKRYQELTCDPASLKSFMERQKARAAQMMKDATIIDQWVMSCQRQKVLDDQTTMSNREASIEAKLLELGWERKYFPIRYESEWYVLVKKPRELTSRNWKVIRPKLEAILERNKKEAIRRDYSVRCDERRRELEPMWTEFLTSMPNQEQRRLMSLHSDACDLPAIAAMLYEDNATIPVTEERWLAIVDSVEFQVTMRQAGVWHDLRQCLKKPKKHWLAAPEWKTETDDITGEESDDDDDFTVLEKASSLFRCDKCYSNLFGHAAIFDHLHFRGKKWVDILPWLRHEAGTELVVTTVLRALKLPEDTPLAAMEQLNGRLMCLCGHPDFQNPTTFGDLIHHIMDENIRYDIIMRTRSDDMHEGVEYQNHHSLTNAEKFVAILPTNDLDTGDEKLVNVSLEERLPII